MLGLRWPKGHDVSAFTDVFHGVSSWNARCRCKRLDGLELDELYGC